VRRSAVLFVALLAFGCTPSERPSGKVDQEPYASARLDVMALESRYLRKINDLLSRKDLPRKVRENLEVVRDFLEGRTVDPYRAYEAVEELEKLQARKGLHLFSALQLKELKELIEMKARYSAPPVA